MSNHSKQILIGNVRYLNILTWIWAFQDKLLYLVMFSLYSSLFWELRDKRNFKKNSFLTRKPRSHVRILIYRTWPNTESCLCTPLFCSQVFKTSVLNSDENIALIAFCSLAVGSLADVEFTLVWCGSLWPIVCYSCRLFQLCFDWIQFKKVSQFLWLLYARWVVKI